jgi:PQQ-dependent catabolism-associated CXXCW motif protein
VKTRPLSTSAALLAVLLALAGCDRFKGLAGQEPGQQPNPWNPNSGPSGPADPNNPYGPAPSYAPNGPPANPGAPGNLDQLAEWEKQNMGVQPVSELHAGQTHGPTPTEIPGGQVITTKGLMPLIQGQVGVRAIVLDVLGGPQTLPNAIPAVWASQPGSFNDQVQQQFGQMLMQVTQGNRQVPIVTYCEGPQCWMSYNAALRAIALGYKNVLWYRGGLQAWMQAQSQMAGVGGVPPGYPQQGGQQPYPTQQQPYPQQYPQQYPSQPQQPYAPQGQQPYPAASENDNG